MLALMVIARRDCWHLRGEAFLEDIEWCRHDGGLLGCLEGEYVNRKVSKDNYLYLQQM